MMRALKLVRSTRYAVLAIAMVFVSVGTVLAWSLATPLHRVAPSSLTPHKTEHGAEARAPGPPWIYGRADARFTLVEYADLECPYCRAYFPVLRDWIDAHPDVNWQWHHLPLSIHDPAATHAAVLVECAGEIGGNRAFWDSVAWLYDHAQDGAGGLPSIDLLPISAPSKVVQQCVQAGRVRARIQAERDAAAHEGITATPTLRLFDRYTGKALTLWGPVDTDALLSAVDFLASDSETAGAASKFASSTQVSSAPVPRPYRTP